MPRRFPGSVTSISSTVINQISNAVWTDPLRLTAKEIWEYAARTLTSLAGQPRIDLMGENADFEAGTGARKALIDTIPSLPAAVWAVATRNVTQHEFEQAYPSDEAQITLNTTGSDQSLGSRNIVVALPVGMAIARVTAAALVTIANRTTTEQRVDLNLKVAGTLVFSQDNVVHVGAIQGTVVIPIAQDATSIVTGSGTYALEAEAQIYAAQNVTFTVQYYLFVEYRKS